MKLAGADRSGDSKLQKQTEAHLPQLLPSWAVERSAYQTRTFLLPYSGALYPVVYEYR